MPTEWQRIGDQIDAAFVFAWSDFVDMPRIHNGWLIDWLDERCPNSLWRTTGVEPESGEASVMVQASAWE